MKIYERKTKAWDFINISLTDITFSMVGQCDEDAHGACKALIYKYEVSNDKQETLNGVPNMWNNCKIKYTSLYEDIWFNELYNLNLKFKNIKAKYEKI